MAESPWFYGRASIIDEGDRTLADMFSPVAAARRAELYAAQQEEQAQRAALQEQARLQAQRDAQLAGYDLQQTLVRGDQQFGLQALQGDQQLQRDYNQFGYRSAESAQQFGQEQQIMAQQEGIQERRDVRGMDLQARLNEIQLTQAENVRRERMRAAEADIRARSDLAPHERDNLITQIRTQLNPLEDRMRETQMLHSQIQTQGLFQQNEMQAQLFNQQQAIRSMNPSERFFEVTGPGGERAMAFLDDRGNPQLVDFNQSARADQSAQNEQARTIMGIGQADVAMRSGEYNLDRAQRFEPVEFAGMLLNNQTRQQALDFAATMQPLQYEQAVTTLADQRRRLAFDTQLDPTRRQLFETQLNQAEVDLNLSRLRGPQQIEHTQEIINGLRESNRFNMATNPDRARAVTANLDALLQRTEQDAQLFPLTTQQTLLTIRELKARLQRGERLEPMQIRQLEAQIGGLEEQRVGGWFRNQAMAVEFFRGAGMTPAQTAVFGRWVQDRADTDVRTENTRRQREGEESLRPDTPEWTAFRNAAIERHRNGFEGVMQQMGIVPGQVTQQQAEGLRQIIRNAPQEMRATLQNGFDRVFGRQPVGQPAGQAPAPAPAGQAAQPHFAALGNADEVVRLRGEAGELFNQQGALERAPIVGQGSAISRISAMLERAAAQRRGLNQSERESFQRLFNMLSPAQRALLSPQRGGQ